VLRTKTDSLGMLLLLFQQRQPGRSSVRSQLCPVGSILSSRTYAAAGLIQLIHIVVIHLHHLVRHFHATSEKRISPFIAFHRIHQIPYLHVVVVVARIVLGAGTDKCTTEVVVGRFSPTSLLLLLLLQVWHSY
jgi:hypothetical protein